MTKVDLGNLKEAREKLCVIQHTINQAQIPDAQRYSDFLQDAINAIDEMRPLGPDGKHGNRHTPYCGCEDVPSKEGIITLGGFVLDYEKNHSPGIEMEQCRLVPRSLDAENVDRAFREHPL